MADVTDSGGAGAGAGEATQGGTATLVRPQLGGGGSGAEHRAHIVKRPPDRESAEAWVTEARVLGLEVEALCGYRWVPARNPERYPVCEACRDILSHTP
jgi:hypothetical protein